jgi:alanine dehydrogenase
MILRRLGPDPHANGGKTSSLQGCPDILEIEGGDFAVIGVDITGEAAAKLAFGANCGPDERIVRIPRRTLVFAKPDIPDRV